MVLLFVCLHNVGQILTLILIFIFLIKLHLDEVIREEATMIQHCLVIVNVVLSNAVENLSILRLKLPVCEARVELISSVSTAKCSDGIVTVNTTTAFYNH